MTGNISDMFARDLTLGAIDGVSEYYELVESKLHSAKEEDREKAVKKVRDMELEWEDEAVEWNIAMQEHESTFEMILPNYFRYSCIVLLFLVLENRLQGICRASHNLNDLPAPPSPRQDIIGKYKDYLVKTVGVSNQHWEAIIDLGKIRNCIVHTSGKVLGFRHENRLRELAGSGIGIMISGTDEGVSPSLQPLYLENDMLMLEPEYCRWIIKTVRDFFVELCDSLSLSPIEFEE